MLRFQHIIMTPLLFQNKIGNFHSEKKIYLDGQHDMGVTLQDFHRVTMSDVIEADPIGCQDLITHFDAILLCQTTRVQPEKTNSVKKKKCSQLFPVSKTQ